MLGPGIGEQSGEWVPAQEPTTARVQIPRPEVDQSTLGIDLLTRVAERQLHPALSPCAAEGIVLLSADDRSGTIREQPHAPQPIGMGIRRRPSPGALPDEPVAPQVLVGVRCQHRAEAGRAPDVAGAATVDRLPDPETITVVSVAGRHRPTEARQPPERVVAIGGRHSTTRPACLPPGIVVGEGVTAGGEQSVGSITWARKERRSPRIGTETGGSRHPSVCG